VGKGERGWGEGVEGKGGGALEKEGGGPGHEGGRETEKAESVKEARGMEVVEEALNVEEQGGGDVAELDRRLSQVGQVRGAINGGTVIPAAELEGREEGVGVDVGKESWGNNLLEQLPTGLQEGDGAIGLSLGVVGFPRLGDDDNDRLMPWVDSDREACCEEGGEAGGGGGKRPLE
jgi:hypothetical protein